MPDELSPETYRTVLESLPTGVYLVDRDRRILLWSSGAEELSGYLRHEVIGRSCHDDFLMHCDEEHACLCDSACPLQEAIHDGQSRVDDLYLLHKDGHRVPVSVQAAPLRDEHGSIIGAIECFERRVALSMSDPVLRRLSLQNSIDPDTGLADRRATEARLLAYLGIYEKSLVPFSVFSIAVDAVNRHGVPDGHNAAEAELRATGQTLAASLSPNDSIGRWSETRLLAIVTGCTTPSLQQVVDRLKRLVGLQKVPWWGERLTGTVSIGAAVVQAGDSLEALTGRAEAALELSLKQRGEEVVAQQADEEG